MIKATSKKIVRLSVKVGDLVMRRVWVGEGILVGESGGEWVGTEDIGVIVGFLPLGSPKVLLSNGDIIRITKESLHVLSPAIGAVPVGGAVPHRKANSSEKISC